MNLLFICSRNEWRSRTAETIFKDHPLHIVKSAGTGKSARIKISQAFLTWADLIFVMEIKHRDRINQYFELDRLKDKIKVLHIPDEYRYMDAELIKILKADLQFYLGDE